jgi:putative redox protein
MNEKLDVMRGGVELLDGIAFEARTGTGHALVLDASPEAGGQERGPRPIEIVLVALAGCTGMDVISILRKMHQDVTGYRIEVQGTRAAEHPRVFTVITVEHIVTGIGLAPEAVERAVKLSRDRYCSVGAMLDKAARVTHTWKVVQADAPASRVA